MILNSKTAAIPRKKKSISTPFFELGGHGGTLTRTVFLDREAS
jgi:hypothetical protein